MIGREDGGIFQIPSGRLPTRVRIGKNEDGLLTVEITLGVMSVGAVLGKDEATRMRDRVSEWIETGDLSADNYSPPKPRAI